MIQSQFVAGNHTVTQSNFDNCMRPPISLVDNASIADSTGLPARRAQRMGMIPAYTIMINNTRPSGSTARRASIARMA